MKMKYKNLVYNFEDLIAGSIRNAPVKKASKLKDVSQLQFLHDRDLIKQFGLWADTDKDRYLNFADSFPFDPRRHGLFSTIRKYADKASAIIRSPFQNLGTEIATGGSVKQVGGTTYSSTPTPNTSGFTSTGGGINVNTAFSGGSSSGGGGGGGSGGGSFSSQIPQGNIQEELQKIGQPTINGAGTTTQKIGQGGLTPQQQAFFSGKVEEYGAYQDITRDRPSRTEYFVEGQKVGRTYESGDRQTYAETTTPAEITFEKEGKKEVVRFTKEGATSQTTIQEPSTYDFFVPQSRPQPSPSGTTLTQDVREMFGTMFTPFKDTSNLFFKTTGIGESVKSLGTKATDIISSGEQKTMEFFFPSLKEERITTERENRQVESLNKDIETYNALYGNKQLSEQEYTEAKQIETQLENRINYFKQKEKEKEIRDKYRGQYSVPTAVFGFSFAKGFIQSPFMLGKFGVGLVTQPITTTKEMYEGYKGLPKQFLENPVEVSGEFLGSLIGQSLIIGGVTKGGRAIRKPYTPEGKFLSEPEALIRRGKTDFVINQMIEDIRVPKGSVVQPGTRLFGKTAQKGKEMNLEYYSKEDIPVEVVEKRVVPFLDRKVIFDWGGIKLGSNLKSFKGYGKLSSKGYVEEIPYTDKGIRYVKRTEIDPGGRGLVTLFKNKEGIWEIIRIGKTKPTKPIKLSEKGYQPEKVIFDEQFGNRLTKKEVQVGGKKETKLFTREGLEVIDEFGKPIEADLSSTKITGGYKSLFQEGRNLKQGAFRLEGQDYFFSDVIGVGARKGLVRVKTPEGWVTMRKQIGQDIIYGTPKEADITFKSPFFESKKISPKVSRVTEEGTGYRFVDIKVKPTSKILKPERELERLRIKETRIQIKEVEKLQSEWKKQKTSQLREQKILEFKNKLNQLKENLKSRFTKPKEPGIVTWEAPSYVGGGRLQQLPAYRQLPSEFLKMDLAQEFIVDFPALKGRPKQPGLKMPSYSILETPSDLRIGFVPQLKQKQELITLTKLDTKLKTDLKTDQKVFSLLDTSLRTRLDTETKTMQDTKLLLRQDLRLLQELKTPLKTGTTTFSTFLFPEEVRPGIPPPVIFGFRNKEEKLKEKPYDAYAYIDATKKTKARYEKLNEEPLTIGGALDQMSAFVDKHISARGKVVPTPPKIQKGKKVYPVVEKDAGETGYWSENLFKFRPYRVRKGQKLPLQQGTYIEKSAFRLDSGQEVPQIQRAKQISNLIFNGFGNQPKRKKGRGFFI